MTTIIKYQLTDTGNLQFSPFPSVAMPKDAQVLSCMFFGGSICVWALVDKTQKENVMRKFAIAPTGINDLDTIDGELTYISTVIFYSNLIFHVFEVTEKTVEETTIPATIEDNEVQYDETDIVEKNPDYKAPETKPSKRKKK